MKTAHVVIQQTMVIMKTQLQIRAKQMVNIEPKTPKCMWKLKDGASRNALMQGEGYGNALRGVI